MRTIGQLGDLTGRVALIAGGAGHIGRAAAEALLEGGARVILLDLDRSALDRARAGSHENGRLSGIAVDLTDEDAARSAVRRVLDEAGRLDILVHAAALMTGVSHAGWDAPFADQTVTSWDLAMRINLTSAFVLAQEAASALAESGKGSMIFFSSIYGRVGPDLRIYQGTSMHNPAGYGVSKAGLTLLARHLATVLAPAVRVNTITPGGVARGQDRAFVAAYEARTPLGRMATEEDLKGAVAFLASDLSQYVTGHDLVVDGGWTAW